MLSRKQFKILTVLFIGAIFFAGSVDAAVLTQKKLKTHYRIELDVEKSQLRHNQKGTELVLQTLDIDLYNKVVADLATSKVPKDYISNITYSVEGYPERPASITVTLTNKDIELFNFYSSKTKKLIFDFWKGSNGKALAQKISQIENKKPGISTKPVAKLIKKTPVKKKASSNILSKKTKSIENIIRVTKKKDPKPRAEFRDFRYGASLIWNYKPLIPRLDKDMELKVKTPDFLYQIKDREFSNDKKEEHMQLSINFYRKKDWGLLKRSVDLYKKKFGTDANKALNEFMLVVALLKDNIADKNRGINAASMNMLLGVVAATDDYELKTASLRFVIQDAIDSKDYLKALKYAKQLYITSASQFDNDLTIKSSEIILHSLARMKQYKKVESFLAEKAVMRVLPSQLGHAYKYFILLSKDRTEEIVKDFELKKKTWSGLIAPSVMFNVAESYFREAKYRKGLKLYDSFVSNYSHMTYGASGSRVRIGLIYDLIGDDVKKVVDLYTMAVDRSSSHAHRYEAKLRLAAVKLTRKYKLSAKDKSYEVLLEKTPQETAVIDDNLNKLLWMVRLRTQINQGKYEEALAYLESIPFDSLTQAERRSFNLDGAETVKGLVRNLYEKNEFSRATRIWELYKEKYSPKVAKSLYSNFLVADSYSQLGLEKSYKKARINLSKIGKYEIRNFPIWVKDRKNYNQKEFLAELDLMNEVRQEQWTKVDKLLSKAGKDFPNKSFYRGLVASHTKKPNIAISQFETVLINTEIKGALTPEQMQQLITNYMEILFKRDENKFIKTASAIIKDLKSTKLMSWNKVIERIEYLSMEALSNGKNRSKKKLVKLTASFLQKYKGSTWEDRVYFLRAKALVKTKKVKEAQEILKNLIQKDKVSAYVKELAKSELTMIELNINSLQ